MRYDDHDTGDQMDDEILRLLQSSEPSSDPIRKGELLILLKMSRSLTQNTDLTRKLASDLEEHRTTFSTHQKEYRSSQVAEQKLLSRGVGAWWGLSVMGVIVWSLSVYIVKLHLDQLTTTVNETTKMAAGYVELKSKLETLERIITKEHN